MVIIKQKKANICQRYPGIINNNSDIQKAMEVKSMAMEECHERPLKKVDNFQYAEVTAP